MQKDKTKTIIIAKCPKCEEEIFIPINTPSPSISSLYTKGLVLEIKEKVKERIAGLKIEETVQKEIADWLSQETTLFMEEDIEDVVAFIKEQYEKKS